MITINGKTPETVTVKAWKELAGYNPIKDNRLDVSGTVDRIAMVYNVTVEDVENELNMDDLLPCFLECVTFCNELVFKKLDVIPKNAGGDGK